MAKTGLTKNDFARVMGVDRAQPTRWAKVGMPLLPDGTIDPVVAADWVRANIDQEQRRRRSVGAMQAHEAADAQQEDALDQLSRLPLTLMAPFVPSAAATAALEAGASFPVAYALYRVLHRRVAAVANYVRLDLLCLPPGELGPYTEVPQFCNPLDWAALAEAAGVELDLAAWEAGAQQRFGDELPAIRAAAEG